MKQRGNCPDCKLRDVACVVHVPGSEPIRLCAHCASAYEPQVVERIPV
jgi:transcription elongation factor Elf1